MNNNHDEVLTSEEAALLWERAAQAAKEAEIARATKAAVSGASASTELSQRDASEGYALEHVRAAALEAGISEEHVDAAVAALRTERSLPQSHAAGKLARRFLDDPPNSISVRRRIDASPREVLSAMESVFGSDPYRMTMSEQRGEPVEGGLMVFDIQATAHAMSQGGFAHDMREIGLKQVFMTLRGDEASPTSCELTLHSPITVHRTGVAVGSILSGITGALGLGAGLGGGALLVSAGVGFAVWPVTAVVGAATGVGLGIKGYRKLYRHAIKKGRKALEGMVGTIAVKAQGGWGS